MSRSMERLDYSNVAINTFLDILTCPAGHKYEVVQVTTAGNLSLAFTTYSYVHEGANYHAFDEIHIPAGGAYELRNYNGMPLYEGEAMAVYTAVAAGGATVLTVVYIDVDYTN